MWFVPPFFAVGHSAGPSATTTSSPRWTLSQKTDCSFDRKKYHESMSQTLRTDIHVHIQYSYNTYIYILSNYIYDYDILWYIMINYAWVNLDECETHHDSSCGKSAKRRSRHHGSIRIWIRTKLCRLCIGETLRWEMVRVSTCFHISCFKLWTQTNSHNYNQL